MNATAVRHLILIASSWNILKTKFFLFCLLNYKLILQQYLVGSCKKFFFLYFSSPSPPPPNRESDLQSSMHFPDDLDSQITKKPQKITETTEISGRTTSTLFTSTELFTCYPFSFSFFFCLWRGNHNRITEGQATSVRPRGKSVLESPRRGACMAITVNSNRLALLLSTSKFL